MKTILKYICFAVSISIVFALFYFKGFSQTTFYIAATFLLVMAISQLGIKYGLNKQLPKQKPSAIVIRLIRYGFGLTLYSMANKILDREFFESLLNSKSFIVALWLWILFEVFIEFTKEFKLKSFQPINSADAKDHTAD